MSDLIDRDEVLALPRNQERNFFGDVIEESIDVEMIKKLPPAQPESCEDAVSRQDAIIQLSHNKNGDPDCDVIIQHDIETLKQLPLVTPRRKTGKWVNNIHDLPVCDQCGYMTPYDRAIDDYEYGNYCPNCGAKMEGANSE